MRRRWIASPAPWAWTPSPCACATLWATATACPPPDQEITGSLPTAEVIRSLAALPLPDEGPGDDPRRLPGGLSLTTPPAAVRRGIGFAVGIKNIFFSEAFDDYAEARAVLTPHGVEVHTAAAEVGQGLVTVLGQIARSATGLQAVEVVFDHTGQIGSAGSTSASRQTQMAGGACLEACRGLREKALQRAGGDRLDDAGVWRGEELLATLADLLAAGPLEQHTRFRHAPTEAPNATGQGNLHAGFCVAAHRAVVDVDPELGLVRVVRVDTAQDVGRALNPQAVLGQIEGGILQGVGLAIMEELLVDRGVVRNASFTDYLIPTILDAPDVEAVIIEDPEPGGPFGAKGMAELPTISSTPAVVAAIRAATGRIAEPGPGSPPGHRRGAGARAFGLETRSAGEAASVSAGTRAKRGEYPGAVTARPKEPLVTAVDIRPASGKLGVLTPGMGAVATTFYAGVFAVRKGLAKPFGSLTQLGHIRLGKRTEHRNPMIKDFVPLASLDDLVFGGWDPIPDDAYSAAKRAGVLTPQDLEGVARGTGGHQAHVRRVQPRLGEAADRHHQRQDRQVHHGPGRAADGRHRPVQEGERLRPRGHGLVRQHRGLPQAGGGAPDPGRLREGPAGERPGDRPQPGVRLRRPALRSALRQRRPQPHRGPALHAGTGRRDRPAHLRQGLQDRPDAHQDHPRPRASRPACSG